MSTETTPEAAALARTEADLLSGYYFTLIGRSARSRYGYQPPVGASYWAAAMGAIATYAKMGDRAADAASKLLGRINLYGTEAQAVEKAADILAEVVRKGWFDVHGATGPNASRESAYQHGTKLRDALFLALLMAEIQAALNFDQSQARIGWALKRLVEQENLTVYASYLPRVANALAD